jgi:hypothetical protein
MNKIVTAPRQSSMETLPNQIKRAWLNHKTEAIEAKAIFVTYCDGARMTRVPGCDTILRLALRIQNGMTPEQAAAREYLYRWNLAFISRICFGAPHTIGL